MADDGLDGMESSVDAGSGSKRGRLGGLLPRLLKWIAIGLGAIILIIVVANVTWIIRGENTSHPDTILSISDNYLQKTEPLDWYKSLGVVKTRTFDEEPSNVVVDVYLGYKKDDKKCSAEITQRAVEMKDFLRSYFASKLAVELKSQNESKLKIEIRNAINDNILSDSKIKSVSFQQLDVISN